MTTINECWEPEAIRFSVDSESGSEIEQLTSEPVTSTNIYCEQRVASADGSRIAISRKPFGRPMEIWVCDLRSLKLVKASEGHPLGGNAKRNAVYFISRKNDTHVLTRLDLKEMSLSDIWSLGKTAVPKAGAVSPDERFFVCGPFHVRDNVYALKRVDLKTGAVKVLREIEDTFNPHLQFNPAGNQFIVQINRGGRLDPSSGKRLLTGPLGATLVVVDVETGDIIPLPAGKPRTPAISGHEAWVGETGRVIFTAGRYRTSTSSFVTIDAPSESERDAPGAAIYSAVPGDEDANIVASGLLFNHLAASDDGRFFIADDHTTGRVHVGDVQTGRYRPLCDSLTRQGACQHGHVHAYMTPDNGHVIFL